MIGSLARILVGVLAAFAPVLAIAYLVGGVSEVGSAAIAGIVCLAAAVATLTFAGWAFRRGFAWQYAAVLLSPVARGAIAIGAGFALFWGTVLCGSVRFWIWLGIGYLITLAAEVAAMLALLRERAARDRRFDG